jgi:hypothetical protein
MNDSFSFNDFKHPKIIMKHNANKAYPLFNPVDINGIRVSFADEGKNAIE